MSNERETAARFLIDLYPEIPPHLRLVIFKLPERRAVWCKTTDDAIEAAMKARDRQNVYLGVSLQDVSAAEAKCKTIGKAFDPGFRRGFSESAGGITGMWADIDIAGPNHKSDKLPPDEAGAFLLIDKMQLRPTWLVRTGGGIHCWWVFQEPWIFDGAEDRARAADLATRWITTMQLHAGTFGWTVDSTTDLARVLRVPGMLNHKSDPPALITAENVGIKYQPDDFVPILAAEALALEIGSLAPAVPAPRPANDSDLSKRLSRRTNEYLAWRVMDGERNTRLFAAATDLAGNGMSRNEAESRLMECARRDGLPEAEARATIESAFSQSRGPARPIGSKGKADDPFGTSFQRGGSKNGNGHALGGNGAVAEAAASTAVAAEATADDDENLIPDSVEAPGAPPNLEPKIANRLAPLLKRTVLDANRPRIENVEDDSLTVTVQAEGKKKGTEKEVPIRYYRTLPMILANAQQATGGWPRRAGGIVFGIRPTDLEIPDMSCVMWIGNAKDLFAYLGHECDIRWDGQAAIKRATGEKLNPATKEEFFSYVEQNAGPTYKAVEVLPHVPLIPDLFYLPNKLPPIPTDTVITPLMQLVNKFNPETDLDRKLLLAALLTPGWGGPPGGRPAFLFTSKHGRGAGKSVTAQVMADVWGGQFTIRKDESWEMVGKRLFGDEALSKRIIMIDNIKGRVSGQDIESFITGKDIQGWKPFFGGMSRPNYMTWYMTTNTAVMSQDLAERSVIIQIGAPQHTKGFLNWCGKFIAEHRATIISELLDVLQSDSQCKILDVNRDRWGAWQDEVLSKFSDGNEMAAKIISRRPEINADIEEGDGIAATVMKLVKHYFEKTYKTIKVFIPYAQLNRRLVADGVSQNSYGPRAMISWVRDKCGSGSLTMLEPRRIAEVRGWLYTGADCDPTKHIPESEWHMITETEAELKRLYM